MGGCGGAGGDLSPETGERREQDGVVKAGGIPCTELRERRGRGIADT